MDLVWVDESIRGIMGTTREIPDKDKFVYKDSFSDKTFRAPSHFLDFLKVQIFFNQPNFIYF
jgi:hypothetical protein